MTPISRRGGIEGLGELLHDERSFREKPLHMGHLAVTQGVGRKVLGSMLDSGMPLSEVIEALVQHGSLPSFDDVPEHANLEVRLVRVDGDWQLG